MLASGGPAHRSKGTMSARGGETRTRNLNTNLHLDAVPHAKDCVNLRNKLFLVLLAGAMCLSELARAHATKLQSHGLQQDHRLEGLAGQSAPCAVSWGTAD
jgi:hypothetical protein